MASRPLQSVGWLGDVGLAQQQRVGQRRLSTGFRMTIERRLPVQRIDERDDAVDGVMLRDVAIGHQRVQDGGGIGKAGGFDQHSVIAHLAGLARRRRSSSVATRSLRTAQHRQPVVSASRVSSLLAISS